MARVLFTVLCALIAGERLLELGWSRAHARRNAARGGTVVREPVFPVMALLHAVVLIAAPAEAWLHRTSAPRALSLAALVVLATATGIRIWALRTLGDAWSVRVTRFPDGERPVVASGPYRYIRHPNYLAVILELIALPLVGGAYLTAIGATIANALILAARIPLEERELARDPGYVREMGYKPRFFPSLGSLGSGRSGART